MTKGYILKYYRIKGWHYTGCEGWSDFYCDEIYTDYGTAVQVCNTLSKRNKIYRCLELNEYFSDNELLLVHI